MERRDYQIEDRDEVLAQAQADGKCIIEDVTINLDENGRFTTCYLIVENALPAELDLLAATDERILTLEYENLILKEGLS